MDRSEVYRLIDGERAYQQARGLPDERPRTEWLASIDYYHNRAWHEISRDANACLENIRKVAALAVACLEQYGCQPREGYEQPPGAGMPEPSWEDAPDRAQWWAVDANGEAQWYRVEPYCDDSEGACWCPGWIKDAPRGEQIDTPNFDRLVDIPLGVDWRLLKRQRPQPDSPQEQ